eukprot:TRINITY_DN19511_c0_g1_i1.p1 TRINITY_DN19511_c0_g1~~TRINITY_DN19511_c0_g1_i1.p1  ORF type:complete len:124 (+),score=24.61 TRINITY_DN19511_c0_g1_i1:110-481(+)
MKLYLLDQNKTIENEIELQPPAMVLGREVDTDVHVMVPGVSRYHCKFEFDGENWTVSDLGSTNGTKVNRELIEDTRISVSYTHLTLPTILLVQISVVAVSLKKKRIKIIYKLTSHQNIIRQIC